MLNSNSTGLVIVDIQGKLAEIVADSEGLLKRCEALIQGASILNLPIVWLEQNANKLGPTSAQLLPFLNGQTSIEKFSFNAMAEPKVVEQIAQANRTDWLICGIEAHICVYQTAVGIKALGLKPHVVTDCISSRAQSNKDLAIRRFEQLDIALTSLEMSLFELVKDCRAEEFKSILSLIR